MTQEHGRDVVRDHPEISALLPWYLNGSIGEVDRRRVEEHLQDCAGCRDELAQEQSIYRRMTAETAVEYMPAASLKRLQARLDGIGAVPERAGGEAPAAAALRGSALRGSGLRRLGLGRAEPGRSMRWPAVMAASVAVMAVALSLLAADRWMQFRARAAQPNFYTVTTDSPHPPGEVIRAVFSPAITLVELQSILDEAQLRIVSGPTEAGVYSLAAVSKRPVSSSLALLRAHSKVRFAESTQPSPRAGEAP